VTAAVFAAGSALLLISGCGSEPSRDTDRAADTSVATSSNATDGPETTTVPPSAPTPSNAPTTAGPVTPPASGTDTCPVGEWIVPQSELQRFYDTVADAAGISAAGGSMTAGAPAMLVFDAAGNAAYRLDQFSVTQDIAGNVIEVVLDGEIRATYVDSGSSLTISTVEPDVVVTASLNGAPFDATDALQDALVTFPVNNAAYVCEGDELVMDFFAISTSVSMRLPRA
jgi:hypothetical protein